MAIATQAEPVRARLAEIRARHDEHIRLHDHPGAFACCSAHAAAADVPALLAALEAALDGHEPKAAYLWAEPSSGVPRCGHNPDDDDFDDRHDESDGWRICEDRSLGQVCRDGCPDDEDGDRPVWPCAPYEAVVEALGVNISEETADAHL